MSQKAAAPAKQGESTLDFAWRNQLSHSHSHSNSLFPALLHFHRSCVLLEAANAGNQRCGKANNSGNTQKREEERTDIQTNKKNATPGREEMQTRSYGLMLSLLRESSKIIIIILLIIVIIRAGSLTASLVQASIIIKRFPSPLSAHSAF